MFLSKCNVLASSRPTAIIQDKYNTPSIFFSGLFNTNIVTLSFIPRDVSVFEESHKQSPKYIKSRNRL